ncbi:MAG TPA: choice-of-anchor L domain-containing protein [Brumimicrobium sp.]|nr:choice-of-anchor L domain-containing protein [Brumimicrobium sp.]
MKYFLTLIISILSVSLIAQLQTSGGQSPAQLVQNVLLGSGVEVSNVNFSGSPGAIGTFNATNASIGIDEGIIMTTGTINPGPNGPHGPNNKEDAGIDNGTPGYGQLSNLVGTSTFNATLLEFDFIPFSDTVRFKYVFASEEYPEFVDTDFNDVFAFFISGPGIPGGTQNMAIIPGTTQPVTINNVNHKRNTQFFQSNGDGNTAPYNSNPYYVQYDGFTKPLEAISKVRCGEKYHLIIAIADVGDAIYDSGIFLEKNSLNSDQPVKVDYKLSSDPYGDGKTMAQSCTKANVTITRSGANINQALTIPINKSGSAVEGLDYSSVPSSVSFAPGQTSISFTIDALNNTALTGIANIILEFEIEDACGNMENQVIELFIKPVEAVEITLNDQSLFCPGEEIELIPEATGGGGGYTYSWSTGATTPTIMVNPASTQVYTVSVTDDCLNETATTSAEVTVPNYDPLTILANADIVEQCPYIPHSLIVEAIGGSGNYTYSWTNAEGREISIFAEAEVAARQTTTYTVVVTDECGESDTTDVTITVLSPPLVLEITPPQQICPGDSVLLTVNPSGGFGDYYYLWPHSEETTQSVWVKPDSNTRYDVIVKDDCQTFQVQTHTLVNIVRPEADFNAITEPKFIGLPITFANLTYNGESYYWDLGDGSSSTMMHPNNTYTVPGTYDITLIATDRYGCLDSITKPLTILEEFYLYIPNSFTPDRNRLNSTFSISTIGVVEFYIKIFNRWGELLFESDDEDFEWDGTFNGETAKDGTYVWKIEYKSIHDKELQTKVGHVNVIR